MDVLFAVCCTLGDNLRISRGIRRFGTASWGRGFNWINVKLCSFKWCCAPGRHPRPEIEMMDFIESRRFYWIRVKWRYCALYVALYNTFYVSRTLKNLVVDSTLIESILKCGQIQLVLHSKRYSCTWERHKVGYCCRTNTDDGHV